MYHVPCRKSHTESVTWSAVDRVHVGVGYSPDLDRFRVQNEGETMLLGMWDEGSKTLTIRRANGVTYKVPGTYITPGGYRVMGVETLGNEVHVLTAPRMNPHPSRRVKISDSGMYKGSTGI